MSYFDISNNNFENAESILDFLNSIQNTIQSELNYINNDLSSNPIINNDLSSNPIINSYSNSSTGVYNYLLTSSTNNIINSILQSSLLETPQYKYILSDDGKDLLEEISYHPDTCKNSTCPIYHVDFTEGDSIIKLPCNHCFVPEAIQKWLTDEKAECPVCREKLPADEIKISKNELYNNSSNSSNNSSPINNYSRNDRSLLINIGNGRQSISNPEISNYRYDDSDDEDLHMAIMASMDTLANEQNNNTD